jgi:hypothetical protein
MLSQLKKGQFLQKIALVSSFLTFILVTSLGDIIPGYAKESYATLTSVGASLSSFNSLIATSKVTPAIKQPVVLKNSKLITAVQGSTKLVRPRSSRPIKKVQLAYAGPMAPVDTSDDVSIPTTTAPTILEAASADTAVVTVSSSPVSTPGAVVDKKNVLSIVNNALTALSSTTSAPQESLPVVNVPETVVSSDDRPDRINAYFQKYKMPLAGYGEKFVEVADSCGMDWRLLPAISVQESTGGKYMRLNNPFGWASAKIGFKDFNEAIEIVGKNLCGLNPKTASYYGNKTTYQKLWSYNGTVNHAYPSHVMGIMEKF